MSDQPSPKPCPFCGDIVNVFTYSTGAVTRIVCQGCGFDAPLKRWNSRPLEEALEARMAELERIDARRAPHHQLHHAVADRLVKALAPFAWEARRRGPNTAQCWQQVLDVLRYDEKECRWVAKNLAPAAALEEK